MSNSMYYPPKLKVVIAGMKRSIHHVEPRDFNPYIHKLAGEPGGGWIPRVKRVETAIQILKLYEIMRGVIPIVRVEELIGLEKYPYCTNVLHDKEDNTTYGVTYSWYAVDTHTNVNYVLTPSIQRFVYPRVEEDMMQLHRLFIHNLYLIKSYVFNEKRKERGDAPIDLDQIIFTQDEIVHHPIHYNRRLAAEAINNLVQKELLLRVPMGLKFNWT